MKVKMAVTTQYRKFLSSVMSRQVVYGRGSVEVLPAPVFSVEENKPQAVSC
jgi:hypothetical protein